MNLTLTVIGSDVPDAIPAAEFTFFEGGGTIGRAPNRHAHNHWMLRPESVSRLHAKISFADGGFYITDPPPGSSNGIFLNGNATRLEIGRPCRLHSGDSFYIQPFTIRAGVSGQEAASASGASRTDGTGMLTGLLDNKQVANARRAPLDRVLDEGSVFQESIPAPRPDPSQKPKTRGSVPDIPSGYNPEDTDPEPFPPESDPDSHVSGELTPVPWPPSGHSTADASDMPPRGSSGRPAAEPGASSDNLTALFAGAGLASVVVTPDVARNVGTIFRAVVQGLLVVLKARQKTKSEFALEQTQFRPVRNNPLKFSANVEDALHNLFVKKNPAFLGPVEAFDDAFKDLRNHQLATLAGVRAAFDAMLAEFSPDRLEQRFERRPAGPLGSHTGRFRYWTMYREHYADVIRDADQAFDQLFGDQFARAYEQQLARLKADEHDES